MGTKAGIQTISQRCHILALVIGCFLLTGCAALRDPEVSQEYRADLVATLTTDIPVSQSFVARRPQLNGVDLWLHIPPGDLADKTLTARLFKAGEEQTPLAEVLIPYETAASAYPLTVNFASQSASASQAYLLELSTNGSPIQLYGRNEDVYPDGNAFYNRNAIETDLAFRTSYQYDLSALLEDLANWMHQAWLVIPLAALLWLPGLVVWNWLGRSSIENSPNKPDFFQKLSTSIGLSIAILAVAMLWSSLVGLSWSRSALWAVMIFLIVALTWQSRKKLQASSARFLHPKRIASPAPAVQALIQRLPDKITLGLAAVLLFSLLVRLIMVRDLAAPPWVDSVHHAIVTRLISETGHLPATYAPYINTNTASYHFGFHTLLASFLWLTNLPLTEGMLILGQVLNALAILSVYQFTVMMTRERSAGLGAALLAGLLSPMPAYYTSWGRYTQLAGMLVLPVAFLSVKFLIEQPHQKILSKATLGRASLTGIACAGLFLTHYRVAIFLACFVAAYAVTISLYWATRRTFLPNFLMMVNGLALSILAALLLSLPWLPEALSSLAIPISRPVPNPTRFFSDFNWGLLTTALGEVVLVFGAAGLVIALLKRRGFAITLCGWVALMFLLANFSALGLPGGWFINNISVEILLYLPLSVLGGFFITSLISEIGRFALVRFRPMLELGLTLSAVLVALLGARALLPLLNPITFLARQADSQGIAWVEKNVPAGEKFLINPFAWGYGIYAGQDGGYWITPLSGHLTLPPPVFESTANDREKTIQTATLSRQALEAASDPDALYALMESQAIQYLFIGARGGVFSPQMLSESELFEQLYCHKSVWVFKRVIDGDKDRQKP